MTKRDDWGIRVAQASRSLPDDPLRAFRLRPMPSPVPAALDPSPVEQTKVWTEILNSGGFVIAGQGGMPMPARRQAQREAERMMISNLQHKVGARIEPYFENWLAGELRLEAPQHPITHQAVAELRLRPYANIDGVKRKDMLQGFQVHSLLVQHNWAAVLGDAERGAEWLLPYPLVSFEFQISGWRVLAFCSAHWDKSNGFSSPVSGGCLKIIIRAPNALARELSDGERTSAWIADGAEVQFDAAGWSIINGQPYGAKFDKLTDLLLAQVRAICITLEAQVAEAIPARAPYKRNEPRKDRGALPALSHHTVSLVRRAHRAAPLPRDVDHDPRRSPRLHLRRGHWRHFDDHKTWIAWQLVGDPDLGFIEKDYRL